MNWDHYDRLVEHLRTIEPSRFDYGQGFDVTEPGCVDCHCRILMGEPAWMGNYVATQRFLSVTPSEASEIWAPTSVDDPEPTDWLDANDLEAAKVGARGIRNALHRLARVAARYPRPESEGEAAFLNSVRALAAQIDADVVEVVEQDS